MTLDSYKGTRRRVIFWGGEGVKNVLDGLLKCIMKSILTIDEHLGLGAYINVLQLYFETKLFKVQIRLVCHLGSK